jgi:hypothetical protein
VFYISGVCRTFEENAKCLNKHGWCLLMSSDPAVAEFGAGVESTN